MSDYFLPGQDPDRSGRAAYLAAMQQKYTYDMTYGVPVSLKLDPLVDASGPGWVTGLIKALTKIRVNIDGYQKVTPYTWSNPVPPGLKNPVKFIGWVNGLIKNRSVSSEAINFFLPPVGVGSPNLSRANSIDDYKKLFATLPLPDIAKRYDSDEGFGYTFVAGPNPVPLRRMNQIPANFPISDTQLHTVAEFQGDSLATAVGEGRIFYCDYVDGAELKNGKHGDLTKYHFAPLIAFAVPRGGGRLFPFAIQCGQSPQGRQIYTPADSWSWKIARNCVSVAHNLHHEVCTHLGNTHLLMEPILVATRRHLAAKHPVQALLSHHFEGTMLINNGATHSLIQPGKAVDLLISAEINSVYPFLAKMRFAYSFTGNYLPTRLAEHQTGPDSMLKLYPYRDDGLPIWNAVATWTNDFVATFYDSDATVQGDTELQAWAAEIADPGPGRVKDFGRTPGAIRTRQDLAEILCMIIWTAGPQHAAVNFPQTTDMTFAPANPFMAVTPEPTGTGHTERDYLDNLPPIDAAMHLIEYVQLLGLVYYTRLGDYSSNLGMVNFQTGPIKAALDKFNAALTQIESDIAQRNTSRFPYLPLRPSHIPQSINI